MTPVEKYFNGERWFCAGGVGIGVIALVLAAYFLFKVKQPFYTGMSWPLLILGLFFLVICMGVFLRSPKDIERVNSILQTNPVKLQQEEIPRMENVMRNFKVIMMVEAGLIVLSVALLAFVNINSSWKGAFTAILIMASLLLCFDWLANKRGSEYHAFLKSQERN